MSVINTNLLSLRAQQNQGRASNGLSTSLERLASGLRVNSAKDDAAGQAIGNRMTSQVTGQQQAMRNANDGVSLSQTAQDALSEVNDRLQRIRELTVQGLNDTLSVADHDAVQAEINLNLKEIDRLSQQSSFNGLSLLDGSAGNVQLQVGANDDETLAVDLSPPGFSVDELGLTDFTVYGIEGNPQPLDTLIGTARNMELKPAADAQVSTDLTFLINGTSVDTSTTDLVRNDSREFEGLYLTRMEDGAPAYYYYNRLDATHYTAENRNDIIVGGGTSLFEDQATVAFDASRATFLDADSTSTSGTLVESEDNYYLRTTDGDGNTLYQLATVTMNADGSSVVQAQNNTVYSDRGADGDEPLLVAESSLTAVDEIVIPDTATINYGGDVDTSGGTRLLEKDASLPGGQGLYIETLSGGEYQYRQADISVIASSKSDINVDASYDAGNSAATFDVVDTVSGESIITLDPSNVQVDYQTSQNTYDDVLSTDEDGYVMNLEQNDDGTYTQATLVNDDENFGTLIRTESGSGDLVIYHQMSFSAVTDASLEQTGGVVRTQVALTQSDEDLRIKTPRDPLATLDRAIARVDDKRSLLGATENRLGSAIDNLGTNSLNLSEARSQIMDADYATEVSNMTREQILQQAGTSVLAQANQLPQGILSLLQ